MWSFLAKFILRNRIAILTVVTLMTIFMGYFARKAEIAYEFARLLPDSDSASVEYDEFRSLFGQDGNVLVLGVQQSDIFELEKFNDWYELSNNIKRIEGIQEVVSVGRLFNLTKNDSLNKFDFKPIVLKKPRTQQELDSIKSIITGLPFYEKFIINSEKGSTVMAITFEKNQLNAKNRLAIVDSIKTKVVAFSDKYKVTVHYSGLPYIRTVIARKIANEMGLFLGLAILVTAIILFLFFRSFLPVLFSLLIVIIGVIWSFGTIVLLGYKITVLSGLIPPLIIVIGVPNCILLLNKYHTEFSKHKNQALGLARMVEKIGVSLFFANVTTAIGFAVFCFTNSQIFVEFGLVSSINVFGTYIVSLFLIPCIFSFLPEPSLKHTKHLDNKNITKILNKINYIVHHKRKWVYSTVIVVIIISLIGITKINVLGYVVDDLPAKDPIYVDLNYFQENYGGVLPFEIVVDTRKENGVFADNGRVLYKINNLQKMIAEYKEFSKPISVVEAIKFSNQAYRDGNPKFYRLPGAVDLSKIAEYASEAKQKQNTFKGFIDSTKQYTRVSVQMADIGSVKIKELVSELKPRIDSIFNYDTENKKWLSSSENYHVTITGSSVMFLKGNGFLVKNLLESLLLAIVLISLVMFTLFMSPKMVWISILPSVIPLLLTAGLMGYFDIHLKPSTILVFSIAFGIASDGTLYFLTKYRQEMKHKKKSISETVSLTIKETGVSMVYTAIILACGFGIFTASSFGGTASLGLLISVTLIVAYCSNLILLPSFLLSLQKRLTDKSFLEDSLIELDEAEEENLKK